MANGLILDLNKAAICSVNMFYQADMLLAESTILGKITSLLAACDG